MNLPNDASNDQSNCPPGYYRRENGMVHQVKHSPIDENKEIASNLSDDDLRTMAREKLSELLQAIDARTAPSLLLSVAREVLDRLEGKPTQRIEQKVEHSSRGRAGEMTSEQLLLVLQSAQASGQLPPGMKLLGSDLVVDADYVDVTVSTDNQ